MIALQAGGNAPVSGQSIKVRIISGQDVDVSAFRLFANGKVQGDTDMVFYGQPVNEDSTIKLLGGQTDTSFEINLGLTKPTVEKIAFTATCDNGRVVSGLNKLSIEVISDGKTIVRGDVDLSGRQEAALILGEVYRRNSEWKFRFVAQGFNGGLKPLAEHFGVSVDDSAPSPSPAPTPKPAPAVNLSKVSLTKEKPSISLAKKDDFGLIKINLNWNQANQANKKSGGWFGSSSNSGIDLDIGAFIAMQDGTKGVVQALGGNFGSLQRAPYLELQGDDRTGSSTTGEWMHINGTQWKHVKEVLIYAFIYEGAANWNATDGVVTLHIPGQGEIETRLTEGGNSNNMCAIARLINDNGSIRVERINQYFKGHRPMDAAFNWGFSWSAGSK